MQNLIKKINKRYFQENAGEDFTPSKPFRNTVRLLYYQ